MGKAKGSWARYMDAISAATHVYVGRAKCGCMMTCVLDVQESPKGVMVTAKYVAQFIKKGLTIERMTLAEFRKIPFGHKCGEE